MDADRFDPEKAVQVLINNMRQALEVLETFPDRIFGVAEIEHELKLALRYSDKLKYHYICPGCQKAHGDLPLVQYFKARWHQTCLAERKGQEQVDEMIKAQEEYRELSKQSTQEF